MDQAQSEKLLINEAQGRIFCQGVWTVYSIAGLSNYLKQLPDLAADQIIIDCNKLETLDSAGAWLIIQICEFYHQRNKTTHLEIIKPNQRDLINLAQKQAKNILTSITQPKKVGILEKIGKEFLNKLFEVYNFLTFTGETVLIFWNNIKRPQRLQWQGLLHEIDNTGFRALPIIALLSFLIGTVLAYQMGLQLKTYGANIYIVNLTGMAILREFGPLITAIIVAGRTSSSFTAEIGLMKINEEIDALQTMGLSPIERLVIPKLFGLIIALPLITVWADFFGIIGSMVMAKGMLGINYIDFLQRFPNVIELSDYGTGLSKAPVFAIIVAAVGCYQGFQVSLGAESVGRLTTKSVVQAIFLIIIADAIFSIVFSWLGL